MSEMTAKFVIDAQNGDVDALAKLYSRTLKGCYFLALKLAADEDKAVEITKKTYAEAFKAISRLKKPEAFDIWMKQNVANEFKKTQNFVFGDAQAIAFDDKPEFLPEAAFEDEAVARRIEQGVDVLPAEQRAVAVLYYNNGMPVSALSKYLNVSESTVGSLLMKARSNLAYAAGAADAEPASQQAPVLSRIFHRSAASLDITADTVRAIFIYAMDEYNKKNEPVCAPPAPPSAPVAQEPVTEQKPAPPSAPVAQEPVTEQKPAPEPEIPFEKAEEAEPQASQAEQEPEAQEQEPAPEEDKLSFLNKEPATVAEEFIGTITADSDSDGKQAIEEINNALSVGEQDSSTDGAISFENYEGISSIAPAKEEDTASPSQRSSKVKIAVIAVAALLIVALIVVFAVFARNKDKNNPQGTGASQSAGSIPGGTSDYRWTPGGFEDCTEIQYYNEYAFIFKSKETGRYGLKDYTGKVVLEPNYVEFTRCSNGKDYTSKGSYHYLVTIEATDGSTDNNKYVLNFSSDSTVTISTTPHAKHASDSDILDSKDYDERDRYFEGVAAARKDGKWGYVSKDKDKTVVPFEYEAVNNLNTFDSSCADYCRAFNGGLVAVKKNGMMGIIDMQNNVIVPFEYSNILQGDNGVFVAAKAGTWGIITVGDAIVPTTEPATSAQDLDGARKIDKSYAVSSEDGINVRSDAGSDFEKLGEIPYGSIVKADYVKSADNGNEWVRIEYKNGYGWVSLNFLEEDGV